MVPTPSSSARRRKSVAEGDVEGGEPAVPEQDPLVVALAARLRPATISPSSAWSDSRVRRPGPRAGAARRSGRRGLHCSQSSTTTLSMIVEQVDLHGADRAVRDDEGAGLDPRRAEDRLGAVSRVASTRMSAPRRPPRSVDHADGPDRARPSCRAERLARLRPRARDPDLVKVEEGRRAARRSRTRCRAPRRGASTRAPGRARWRAPTAVIAPVRTRGQLGGVDDRQRYAGARVVEREEPELGRQPAAVVVDEVADDLDAGDAERSRRTRGAR